MQLIYHIDGQRERERERERERDLFELKRRPGAFPPYGKTHKHTEIVGESERASELDLYGAVRFFASIRIIRILHRPISPHCPSISTFISILGPI